MAPVYFSCNFAVDIPRDAVTYYCLWCAERFPRPSDRPTDGGDDESTEANSRNGVGCIIELSLSLFLKLRARVTPSSLPRRGSPALLVLLSSPGDNISANTNSGNPLASTRLPPVRVMP